MKSHIRIISLFLLLSTHLSGQNLIHPKIAGPGELWVNSYNGVLFFGRTDAETQNTQMPMTVRFYYNSSYNDCSSAFGAGFSMGMLMQYEVDAIGGVTIESGDGRKDHYVKYATEYDAPAGVFSTLTQPQYGQFLLTEKTGEKYEFFDQQYGHLTAMQDRYGSRTTLTWQDSLLVGIQDAVGHTVTLSYTNGLLTGLQANFLDGTISYTYDEQRRLRSVRDANGATITYAYDKQNRLSKITDANGAVTQISYNSAGMVSRMKTAVTDKSIRYEKQRTVFIDYTQPKNQYSYYGWDNQGRVTEKTGLCCGVQARLEYDDDDNVIARTDANGNTTRYTYDERGNMLTETDPLGYTATYTYSADFNQVTSYQDKNGQTYRFTYDQKGNLIRMNGPLGFQNNFTYNDKGWLLTAVDANSNVTAYTYNQDGTIASVMDASGNTTAYTYDKCGNITSITNPRGYSTQFTYDKAYRLIKQRNALGGEQTLSYDNVGNIVRMKDEANHTHALAYDAVGNILSVTNPLGGTTRYSYDGKGNVLTSTDPLGLVTTYTWDERNHLLSETNPAGERTSYEYDGVGNCIMAFHANGNIVNYVYDAANRLITVSDKVGLIATYTYDGNGNVLTETDGEGRITTYTYDALNRLVVLTDPTGNTTGYTYDGNSNVTAIEDALHNMHTLTWSPLNQLASETDALQATTQYEYDTNGNLSRITDALGRSTIYTYDALDRNTVITFANARSLHYTYDAVGNIIRAIDRAGNTTTQSYDALGQLLSRQYAGGTADSYSYDAAGQMLSANNAAANIAFTYDNAGRLLSEQMNGKTTSYTYRIADNIRRITYPSGTIVEEHLNARDQVAMIVKNGSEVMQAEYNTASQYTNRTMGNGVITQYTYDANGRLSGITDNRQLMALQMTYDAVGNMLSRINTLDPSRTETYTYDAIGQLIQTQRGTHSVAWSYDMVNNRTRSVVNGTSTNYSADNMNAYTAVGSIIPQYDNNGNLVNDGTHTYAYDLVNRLIKTDADNTYAYDALGRRVAKNTSSQQLTYFYVGDQMVEEYNQGQLTRQYVYGTEIDEIIQMQAGDATYYYHTNHLGSVMVISDYRGNLVEYMDYDAFGQPSFFDADGTSMVQSKIGNTILFTGREYDYESGNYYFRARHMHPSFGRFMQHDPLLYIDGMNDYAYVGNNVFNYIDSYGTVTGVLLSLTRPILGTVGKQTITKQGGKQVVQKAFDLSKNEASKAGAAQYAANYGKQVPGATKIQGAGGFFSAGGSLNAFAGEGEVPSSPGKWQTSGELVGGLAGGPIAGALAGLIVGGPVGGVAGFFIGLGGGFVGGWAGGQIGKLFDDKGKNKNCDYDRPPRPRINNDTESTGGIG